MTDIKTHRQVVRTVKTVVTLTQKDYDPILRAAVGAPDKAKVDVEDNYGGDITITWEDTTYEGDD